MNLNQFISLEGEVFESITAEWTLCKGRHGDGWVDIGRLTNQGKTYVLHRLGQLNRYRIIDTNGPFPLMFREARKMNGVFVSKGVCDGCDT